jgi:hypothetical protein
VRHKEAVNHESANTQRRLAVTAVPDFQVSKISASQATATTGPAATVAASRGGAAGNWKAGNPTTCGAARRGRFSDSQASSVVTVRRKPTSSGVSSTHCGPCDRHVVAPYCNGYANLHGARSQNLDCFGRRQLRSVRNSPLGRCP